MDVGTQYGLGIPSLVLCGDNVVLILVGITYNMYSWVENYTATKKHSFIHSRPASIQCRQFAQGKGWTSIMIALQQESLHPK